MKNKENPKGLYSVHPAVFHVQAVIRNLPEKTGRSLEEWIQLVKKSGPTEEKERRIWLKNDHKLGGMTLSLILDRMAGRGVDLSTSEAYLEAAPKFVEALYSGPRAGLRPLHDELVQTGRELGPDVNICPTKTMVPLYRKNVFAQIKPTTQTRIDLGLALTGVDKTQSARLIDTGGLAKGDRITSSICVL